MQLSERPRPGDRRGAIPSLSNVIRDARKCFPLNLTVQVLVA
jgi:hypothetical protein